MELESYNKRDLSISFWAANIYATIYVLPVIAILYFVYWFAWEKLQISFNYPYWLVFLLGILIHELIHGLVAIRYSKLGIRSVEFGISWKLLTPYCHCKEPLTVKNYRVVALAPLILLGIIPTVIGFIIGHNDIYIFGLLFILAAGGDLAVFWNLRNEQKDSFVLDYKDRCGCLVYINPKIDEQK